MERQLWFDAVGRGSNSMANYAVPIANPGNFNVSYASNNSVSQVPNRYTPVQNTNTSPIPNRGNTGNATVINAPDPLTQTIACNQCQNGYAVGNLFSGTVCPSGWTTDLDPCATRGNNTTVVNNAVDPVRGNDNNVLVNPNLTPQPEPMVSVKCYQCQGGLAVENIFSKPQSNPICDNGWSNDPNIDCGLPVTDFPPLIDDIVYPGGPVPPAPIYQNVCYSCVDGAPKADVFPSEIKDLCPEGYSQDNKVCEDTKTGDSADVKTAGFDNKLILYIAIGVGAYLLLKK